MGSPLGLHIGGRRQRGHRVSLAGIGDLAQRLARCRVLHGEAVAGLGGPPDACNKQFLRYRFENLASVMGYLGDSGLATCRNSPRPPRRAGSCAERVGGRVPARDRGRGRWSWRRDESSRRGWAGAARRQRPADPLALLHGDVAGAAHEQPRPADPPPVGAARRRLQRRDARRRAPARAGIDLHRVRWR